MELMKIQLHNLYSIYYIFSDIFGLYLHRRLLKIKNIFFVEDGYNVQSLRILL
jgi:hypothetical protein